MNNLSESSPEILYTVPISMYLLFWMAGMAFVISSVYWLSAVIRTKSTPETNFTTHIWINQIINIVAICIISIGIGIYEHITLSSPLTLYGEITTIATISFLTLSFARKKRRATLLNFYKNTIILGLSCAAGWLITIGIAVTIFYALKPLIPMSINDCLTITFMVTGASWCAPVFILYRKIMSSDELSPALTGQKFYRFLWPVLLAYYTLLVPLLCQQIANNEKWRKMTNDTSFRGAQVDIYQERQNFPFV